MLDSVNWELNTTTPEEKPLQFFVVITVIENLHVSYARWITED